MNQGPTKNTTDNNIGKVVLIIIGLAAAALLLKFLGYLFSQGWSVASEEVPAGKTVFIVVIGVLVYLLGPWLIDHGYKSAGKFVILCVVVLVTLTAISIIPSCNYDYDDSVDLPYYRR